MNRKNTLFLVFGFLSTLLGAQTAPNDTANVPYWIEMAQDPKANYYQTVRAFDLYWENRPVEPHSGYKVFLRWKEYWSHHIDEYGNREPADKNMQAWLDYNGGSLSSNVHSLAGGTGDWKALGPFGNPVFNTPMAIGNGRINTFTFHPTDSNKMIIGAPQGGAWITTDNCQSWTPMTDNLPTLGVSSVVWDYSNTNIILLGTGDRDFGDAPGLGVYKSTNGGQTWTASNTGFIGVSDVYSIVQNPLNPNVMIAGTNSGAYYSSNKGNRWTQVFGGAKFKDIKYKPGDTSVLYSSTSGYFYRATNGGQTWTDITATGTSGLPSGINVQRYMVGVTPAAPNMVCLIATNGNTFRGFYVSTDGGFTFRTKTNTPNILGYNEDASDNGGQAMYDLSIGTRRDSANIMYVGGINIFQSQDTGATWDCIGHWVGSSTAPQVHADQHWMAEHPITRKLFAGCDGGLYVLQPNGTWANKNSNLAISQIYRIGQSPFRANRVVAGFQDNGTSIHDPNFGTNPWKTQIQADGMECIMDPKDTGTWYGEIYYGNIIRNGTTYVGPGGESGPWITPYLLHGDSNNIMFVGMYNIWRNRKINKTPIGNWEKLTTGINVFINEVHNCRSNPNIIYFNKQFGSYRTSRCLDPVASVRFDTLTPVATNQAILDFETSFIDSNIVYALAANNNVYLSVNRGQSWTAYSTGLPNATKFCLLSDKHAKRGLYCGTFNGIYYRDSTMSSWVYYSSGLPVNSAIREMDYYYDSANTKDCRITAATYGRGLWQSPPYLQNTAPEAAFFMIDTNLCANTTYTINDNSQGNPDSWHWTITPSTFSFVNGSSASSQFPQVQFSAPGVYSIKLFVKKEGYGYSTLAKNNYLIVSGQNSLSVTPSSALVCNGDSVQLTASGGNGAYTWSPAAGLNKTTGNKVMAAPSATTVYSVFSGNTTCKDSAGVTVTVNSKPQLTTSGNATICEGESVQLTVRGALFHKWSPATGLSTDTGTLVIASPLNTTTYKIVGISAGGCKDSVTITVTVTPRVNLIVPANTKICNGSGVTLQVSGGSDYAWSPATGLNSTVGAIVIANPVTTTWYTIVATKPGYCSDTDSVLVHVINKPNLSIAPNPTIHCEGDSIVLTATGADQFQWSPAAGLSNTNGGTVIAKPLGTTAYTLVGINDSLCKDSITVLVKVNKKPLLSIGPTSAYIYAGQLVTLGVTGASTYTWWPAAGLNKTTGDTVVAGPTVTTRYWAKGTNADQCTDSISALITVIGTGINTTLQKNYTLYPNPNDGVFTFDTKESGIVGIFNIEGKELFSQAVSKGTNTINLANYAKGVYILRFTTDIGSMAEIVVVK
jgi:hypothetical protein